MKDPKKKVKREDINLAETVDVIENVLQFSYMVHETSLEQDVEILLASIPAGYAIIDTGCTTCVIGAETAKRYQKFFKHHGFPPPSQVDLPAVELRGFNGQKETTSTGLRWQVQLGVQCGTITTYVIPGNAPFLLSRNVLEGMEAVIDLQGHTITSSKHGMFQQPLKRASNGHLLLPLVPEMSDWQPESDVNIPNEPNTHDVRATVTNYDEPSIDLDHAEGSECPKHIPEKNTLCDIRRAFQHVVKNTKRGIVDLETFQKQIDIICEDSNSTTTHAFVAYKPRLERMPHDASTNPYEMKVVSLDKDGNLASQEWTIRAPNSSRRPVNSMQVAVFAFRPLQPEIHEEVHNDPSPSEKEVAFEERRTDHSQDFKCDCCCVEDPFEYEDTQFHTESHDMSLETLYGDTDWVDVELQSLEPESREKVAQAIRSARAIGVRIALSRLETDYEEVVQEVETWLGTQASKLHTKVGLIEVFTGKAPLSKAFERVTNTSSIRIGLEYGHDLISCISLPLRIQIMSGSLFHVVVGEHGPVSIWHCHQNENNSLKSRDIRPADSCILCQKPGICNVF